MHSVHKTVHVRKKQASESKSGLWIESRLPSYMYSKKWGGDGDLFLENQETQGWGHRVGSPGTKVRNKVDNYCVRLGRSRRTDGRRCVLLSWDEILGEQTMTRRLKARAVWPQSS